VWERPATPYLLPCTPLRPALHLLPKDLRKMAFVFGLSRLVTELWAFIFKFTVYLACASPSEHFL
jgi:hypothetical protein